MPKQVDKGKIMKKITAILLIPVLMFSSGYAAIPVIADAAQKSKESASMTEREYKDQKQRKLNEGQFSGLLAGALFTGFIVAVNRNNDLQTICLSASAGGLWAMGAVSLFSADLYEPGKTEPYFAGAGALGGLAWGIVLIGRIMNWRIDSNNVTDIVTISLSPVIAAASIPLGAGAGVLLGKIVDLFL
jgi:hypothetical protein